MQFYHHSRTYPTTPNNSKMEQQRSIARQHPVRVLFCVTLVLMILLQLQEFQQIANFEATYLDDANETNNHDNDTGWEKRFPGPLVPPTNSILFTPQVVDITHVFSTYSTEPGSSAYREMSVVQLSLLRASEYALKTKGLVVEFIDTTLPNDSLSSPSFAMRHDLKSYFVSANNDGTDVKHIPTVGEYFNVALEKAKGELIITTNADIGVTEDFYVRAYAWANKNYLTTEAQLQAMRAAAEFFSNCTMFAEITIESIRFCAQDSKQMYINAGGFEELWTFQLSREVAFMAGQLLLMRSDITRDFKWIQPILSTLLQVNELRGKGLQFSNREAWEEELVKFQPLGPTNFSFAEQKYYFAGTITRLDFPEPEQVLHRTASMQKALDVVLQSLPSRGKMHPGNDLFVMHREVIRKANLFRFFHPTGLRPFGAWIPVLVNNAAKIPFRRITSHRNDPWSFHIGVGKWGGRKINFRERLEKNPEMTLFLAANFNRIGGEVFEKQISDAPKMCKENIWRGWRDKEFCLGNAQMCVGVMRLSCEKYMHRDLRDVLLYRNECNKLTLGGKRAIQEPVCSFCHFLMDQRLAKPVACLNGTMPFCEHLQQPGACF